MSFGKKIQVKSKEAVLLTSKFEVTKRKEVRSQLKQHRYHHHPLMFCKALPTRANGELGLMVVQVVHCTVTSGPRYCRMAHIKIDHSFIDLSSSIVASMVHRRVEKGQLNQWLH